MITSVRNPRVVAARRLKRRRERKLTGYTTIDGPFLLQEAQQGGAVIREVFALPEDDFAGELAEAAGVPVVAVSADVLKSLTSSVNPRGPVAVIDIPPSPAIMAEDAIVMWEVGDPGNAGTVIRSASAFGFQVVAGPGTVDLWSPKVLRAGAGGHFRTGVIEGISEFGDLDRIGLVPLALTTRGIAISKIDLSDAAPVAFVLGNEAHGLPTAIKERATGVALPMPGGTESLNAGVAASIAMYLRMSRRP